MFSSPEPSFSAPLTYFPPIPVTQATAYISEGASAPMTEEEAVRGAVVTRIEFLDANFLAALNGYIQVCVVRCG